MNAIRKAIAAKRENDEGFTLIELLVVVLIIGILAAIAIPVFLGQQATAHDAAAKSDLANAKIAVISHNSTTGSWPAVGDASTSLSSDDGFTPTDGVTTSIVAASATDICLSAISASGTTFYLGTSGGVTTVACT